MGHAAEMRRVVKMGGVVLHVGDITVKDFHVTSNSRGKCKKEGEARKPTDHGHMFIRQGYSSGISSFCGPVKFPT